MKQLCERKTTATKKGTSVLSDRKFKQLSKLLRKQFPDLGEAYTFSFGGGTYQPFEFHSAYDEPPFKSVSFSMGHGTESLQREVTQFTDSDKTEIIDFIDDWARSTGFHVGREVWQTNSNVYMLRLGFMKIESDEVEITGDVYHITSPKNLESIKQTGLVPRKSRGRGGRVSTGRFGEPAGGRSYPARTFLFTDRNSAVSRAKKDANIAKRVRFQIDVLGDEERSDVARTVSKSEKPVLLTIDGSYVLDAQKDPDYSDDVAVYTKDPIPPEAIKSVETIEPNIDATKFPSQFYRWKKLTDELGRDEMDRRLQKFLSEARLRALIREIIRLES